VVAHQAVDEDAPAEAFANLSEEFEEAGAIGVVPEDGVRSLPRATTW
jgi:hypothetical protein